MGRPHCASRQGTRMERQELHLVLGSHDLLDGSQATTYCSALWNPWPTSKLSTYTKDSPECTWHKDKQVDVLTSDLLDITNPHLNTDL